MAESRRRIGMADLWTVLSRWFLVAVAFLLLVLPCTFWHFLHDERAIDFDLHFRWKLRLFYDWMTWWMRIWKWLCSENVYLSACWTNVCFYGKRWGSIRLDEWYDLHWISHSDFWEQIIWRVVKMSSISWDCNLTLSRGGAAWGRAD